MKQCLALFVALFALVVTAPAQTASLTASTSSYSSSGGTVTFTATVTYPSGGTPSAIGFAVNLPSGWGFVSQSLPSSATAVGSPSVGDTSLGWAFSGFPPTELRWTFVASYAAGLTGTQTVSVDSTQSVYRPGPVALSAPDVSFSPALPQITSSSSASCAVNTAFSYTVTASESPTSYSVTGLPSWLSFDSGTDVISGTPTQTGTYSVSLSAANANGTGSTTTLTITVGDLPQVTSKLTASATAGSAFSYGITASNSPTSFSASGLPAGLSINRVTGVISGTPSAAGTANVTLSAANDVGSGSSATLVITIAPNPSDVPTAPVLTTQPVAQSVALGATVTFKAAASGSGVTYQWQRNGQPIAGATGDTLSIANTDSTWAGDYSVVATNSVGSTTSTVVPLTVQSVTYFGSFANSAGTFSLLLRPDRTGVFLGYDATSKLALVSQDIVMDASGHFGAQIPATAALQAAFSTAVGDAAHPVAADTTPYAMSGSVAADGSIAGSISGLGLTLSAPAPESVGATSALAGFYESGAAGSSATTYTIVGAAGDAYVAIVSTTGSDGGKATVDASGALTGTTANNTALTGTVGSNALISLSATPAGASAPTVYSGGNSSARQLQRLINISTRAVAGSGDATLIAGFTVSGSAPKLLLIRGIGPTLKTFGLNTALLHPRLRVFNQQTGAVIASNTGWSTSTDAAAIAAAENQVGAFGLPSGSDDSVLLIYLAPGIYTAQVDSTDGTTGVAMVEVYEVE